MKLNINIKEYFFYYLLLAFFLLTVLFSYLRFMINHDYVLYYEGECDPNINSCYVGCNDNECTDKYYYSKIYKYAPDLLNVCGGFVDGCSDANVCLISDKNCEIKYCDSQMENTICESRDQSSNDYHFSDKDILLNNN